MTSTAPPTSAPLGQQLSPSLSPPLSPRRLQLLDAALHVAADEGLHGLTHRAVDRRAGLPEGTCSAYLRTRQALLAAVTEYVAGRLATDVDDLAERLVGCAGDPDRAVALTMELFDRWVAERELIVTKLELSMEAARNPELAATLGRARGRLIGVVDAIMAGRGKKHSLASAEALVAAFDGILVAALQQQPEERRAFLTRTLSLTLHALSDPTAGS